MSFITDNELHHAGSADNELHHPQPNKSFNASSNRSGQTQTQMFSFKSNREDAVDNSIK
jgi:hypothetical protein